MSVSELLYSKFNVDFKKAPSLPKRFVISKSLPIFFEVVSTKDDVVDSLVKVLASSNDCSSLLKIFLPFENLNLGLTLIRNVESISISNFRFAL